MRVKIYRIVYPCTGGLDDYAMQHKATVTVKCMSDALRLANSLNLGACKLLKVSDES
jgi:hypothetical protein